MTTARTIIERAYKKIGVLGAGQSLTAEEAQDGLIALNYLLESWSIEGGLVYTETEETFPLTSAQSYTIGSGGDFDTTRPVNVKLVTVKQGTIDYTLDKYDQIQFGEISQKALSGIPTVYYYNGNQPLATISFYPKPDSVTSCTIYSVKELARFATLDTDQTLAVGYGRALEFNLCIDLAPEHGITASPEIVKVANESKAAIFTANSNNDNNAMTVDEALTSSSSRFDIYRGY